MKRIFKWAVIAIGVALILIQIIRPDRTNPEFDRTKDFASVPGADTAIAALLRRACYDCHSFESSWPWYSNVAPVSWVVVDDVQEGRRHVNFSLWGKYPPSRRAQSLDDIHDQITLHNMPLPKYLLLHPEARLTQAERDSVVAWADREREKLGDE